MPLLYEQICQPRKRFSRIGSLALIKYDIRWPRSVSCGEVTKKLELKFPYNKTQVHTVNFTASGELVTSGTILTPNSAEVVLLVNGVPVGSKGISACWIPGCRAKFSINTNIYAHLQEGWNDFTVRVRQSLPLCLTVVENLHAYLQYEYSGPPPPPPEEEEEEWMPYLKWGLIGIGAIVTIGLVVPKVIELARKPKG